jgi:hypothetical protein
MSERRELKPPNGSGASIIDGELFRFLIDLEVRKAQRLRYCVSLVCLAANLRPHPSEPPFAEIIARHIRATDAVARWASASLALLLVDAEVTSLPSIVHRLTKDLPTEWSAGGSGYPRTATGAGDLLRQATDMMLQAQQDGGARIYLAR